MFAQAPEDFTDGVAKGLCNYTFPSHMFFTARRVGQSHWVKFTARDIFCNWFPEPSGMVWHGSCQMYNDSLSVDEITLVRGFPNIHIEENHIWTARTRHAVTSGYCMHATVEHLARTTIALFSEVQEVAAVLAKVRSNVLTISQAVMLRSIDPLKDPAH